MKNLTILNESIRTDAEGRFCLNDCHKASGLGMHKKPSKWLPTQQAQDLIAELDQGPNSGFAFQANHGGDSTARGTFAVKEIVYAYAMWISPAFHLKVIRAFDAMVTGKITQPQIPTNFIEALRLAADKAEQLEATKIELSQKQEQLSIAAPKAEALDRLEGADGDMCVTDAAKSLGVRPKDLFSFLHSEGWIFRRVGKKGWLAYGTKMKQGLLAHSVSSLTAKDGSEKILEQVKITPKGLAKLAKLFEGME